MKISVLGCGRWGSFLAWYNCAMLNNDVISYGPDDETYRELKRTGRNEYVVFD